ncbi:MAG TPA: hypothetical protein VF773_00830 [Verrucomicrobiae bacterium]
MPYLLSITVAFFALAIVACKSGDSPKQPASTTQTPRNRTATATIVPATNKPAIRAANVVSGRVVGVRDTLRFVVVDFANGRMPQIDQRLNVYRLEQKVAELKVSGPYRGTTVAADITVGEVMVGDQAREY